MKFGNLGRYGYLINTEHLHEVRSGYFQHMWFAIKISSWSLLNPLTGFIHAFVPFLFPNTPHRIALRTVEMAEELIAELKSSIEAEDAKKTKNN
jgi:hypothetical protein